jgi:hypothetical protein
MRNTSFRAESAKSWTGRGRVGAMATCATCHLPATTRDGFDRRGRQRFACHPLTEELGELPGGE